MTGEQDTRSNKRMGNIEDALKEINGQLKEVLAKVKSVEDNGRRQEERLILLENVIEESRLLRQEVNTLKAENRLLKNQMKELQDDIDDMGSESNKKLVEIAGIPEVKNENLTEIIIKLGDSANVKIQQADISKACRLIKRRNMPGVIEVEFSEFVKRNEFMKGVKKLRPRLENLNFEGKGNVYVNDKLTPKVKNLLYRVKQEAREKGKFNKIWTYSGKIFLNLEKDGQPIRVASLEDLVTLLK